MPKKKEKENMGTLSGHVRWCVSFSPSGGAGKRFLQLAQGRAVSSALKDEFSFVTAQSVWGIFSSSSHHKTTVENL